ncbi:hypothetical protein PspLS_03531 [Pyricularia sp. CBS 133598]|nr:hypothetical protein PspLS_03531 [Pyricularia sp. CBS 133598]
MHFECTICLAVARTGAVNEWASELNFEPAATFRVAAPESIGSKTFPSMETVAASIDGLAPLIFGEQQQAAPPQLSWMSPALPRLLIDRAESQPA